MKVNPCGLTETTFRYEFGPFKVKSLGKTSESWLKISCTSGAYLGDQFGELAAAGVKVGDIITLSHVYNESLWDVEINEFKEVKLNGRLFSGVVVRTKQIPAGEGLTTGVPQSDLIFEHKKFIAPDEPTARGIIIAAALMDNPKLDFTSQVEKLEVFVHSH